VVSASNPSSITARSNIAKYSRTSVMLSRSRCARNGARMSSRSREREAGGQRQGGHILLSLAGEELVRAC
jgi:hypothetical protein